MQYPEKRKPRRFQENILVRGREVLKGELPTEGEASPPSSWPTYVRGVEKKEGVRPCPRSHRG